MTLSHHGIASIIHAANRAYRNLIGEDPGPEWDALPAQRQDTVVRGVRAMEMDRDRTPQQSHAEWVKDMVAKGWSYGPVQDNAQKLHPCIMPWDELPLEQKLKDDLFLAITRALLPH